MSRVNNKASKLIELYCEVDFEINVAKPRISKIYPKHYAFEQVLKIVPVYAFPLGKNTEK